MQYNVLDRFMGGTFEISRQLESGGGSGTNLRWDHHQQFNLSTNLTFSINYVSNSVVVLQNALNPLQNTQQVNSSLSFQKRFRWGLLNLGGNRRQSLSDGSSSTELPALTISPKPIDISRNVTWSPNLSLTNDLTAGTPLGTAAGHGAERRRSTRCRRSAARGTRRSRSPTPVPIRRLQLAEFGRLRGPHHDPTPGADVPGAEPGEPGGLGDGLAVLSRGTSRRPSTGRRGSTSPSCSSAAGGSSRAWASPTRPARPSPSATGRAAGRG